MGGERERAVQTGKQWGEQDSEAKRRCTIVIEVKESRNMQDK